MFRRFGLRDLDWTLLIVVLVVCAVGVLQIYSTLHATIPSAWWHQVLYVAGGLVLMWFILSADYHAMLHHVPAMYAIAVAALLATYLLGDMTFGSRRWIPLGFGFHLQVSEFVKLVIILLVSRYLTDLRTEELDLWETLKLAGLVLIPAALVVKQPDLGTALTYLAVLMVCIFLAGLAWKYVAVVVVGMALAAVVAPYVAPYFLKDYQLARLGDPDLDPSGAGYQVIQSKTAIGSGGMYGKGMTKGTQALLHFLPVPDKDFIFSAFAEEHGFLGVVVMLALYFVMVMRIVQNAQMATERSGMYISMGVAGLLLFHILINVGMVTGLMPVTGIPLPFMSRGGSSIWASFMALGLVNNVRLRRFVN
jgi:rod shape determining protein RodA